MMNCGYDPKPDGVYDLPPIAPQMWQAFHIAGEQMAMMIVAALVQRQSTGRGQHLSCADPRGGLEVHRARPDELGDARRSRSTARRAATPPTRSPVRRRSSHTKDGRWILAQPVVKEKVPELLAFLEPYGMDEPLRSDFERTEPAAGGPGSAPKGRYIPGSSRQTDLSMRCHEALQRLFGKFTFEDAPWAEAQDAGHPRRPAPPARGEHRRPPLAGPRGLSPGIDHPELGTLAHLHHGQVGLRPRPPGRSAAARRGSTRTRRPCRSLLDVLGRTARPPEPDSRTEADQPFPLAGVRIFDFSWFLASAGGTRFLAALGAEVIKVEWKANPDSRLAPTAMAPKGGREARDSATGPLEAISAAEVGEDYQNMGGQFHIKNPGKLGISLNVRDPRGLEIAKRLIAMSDVVAEGFSPGVLERWGLGYDVLRSLRPGHHLREAVGHGLARAPTAACGRSARSPQAFSGISELSGLPEPALPGRAGATRISTGSARTASRWRSSRPSTTGTRPGEGQWIDASQSRGGAVRGGHELPGLAAPTTAPRSGPGTGRRTSPPRHTARTAAPGRTRGSRSPASRTRSGRRSAGSPGTTSGSETSAFATLADRIANQDELDRARDGLDRRGRRLRGDAGASGGRSPRRRLPDGRRPLRARPAAPPP